MGIYCSKALYGVIIDYTGILRSNNQRENACCSCGFPLSALVSYMNLNDVQVRLIGDSKLAI